MLWKATPHQAGAISRLPLWPIHGHKGRGPGHSGLGWDALNIATSSGSGIEGPGRGMCPGGGASSCSPSHQHGVWGGGHGAPCLLYGQHPRLDTESLTSAPGPAPECPLSAMSTSCPAPQGGQRIQRLCPTHSTWGLRQDRTISSGAQGNSSWAVLRTTRRPEVREGPGQP